MSSLERLPPEVLLTISDHLDPDDRKNLSLVNSGLRSALAPCLFRVLRVNCPLVEDHIVPIIVTKYGAHFLELRLDVTFYPKELEGYSQSEEEENEEESGPKWYWTNPPASVWARQEADVSIIHDLIKFKNLPRCKTLTLYTNGEKDFKMLEADWDDNDIAHNYIYFCAEPESWEEVMAKEQKYPWRAALRDMYHDIATLSTVDDLRILNFLPRKTSFWQKDEWVVFLGRLKKLTLHTYGGNNDGGWQANTLSGFHAFFHDLPDTMLSHAKNLEYLEIKADSEGFLGGDFGGDGSLYLAPGSLPALRVLHVNRIAVTSVLTTFLQEVDSRLSEIRITECVSLAPDNPHDKQPTWEDLWKAVRQTIKAPAEVVFVPTGRRPITPEEYYYCGDDPYKPPPDEEERIKTFRKKLKEEDGFCIWPYAWIDTKYGFVFPDCEMNLARLESGEDNVEFKLLMEEVRRGGGRCVSI